MIIDKLGNYITEVSVRNKNGSVTDVFSVTNSQGFIKSTDYFSKEVFSKDITNYKIVNQKEFAYNPSRINVGSIDYLKQDNKVVISPLYVVFKCYAALNEEYLKVFLKSPIGNSRIRAKTKGAVRDTLSYGSLCELKIPVPSLPEQLHIANLLSKAENLISQRKESIRLLDEFLKSTFLDMFGDPNSNSNHFLNYSINDLKKGGNETFSNGPFGSDLLTSELTNKGVPVIYVRDIKNGSFIWKSEVFVTESKADYLRNCHVIPDDVIIAKVGDPPGMSAVYPKGLGRSVITQDVIRIRLNQDIILPIYFSQFLNSEFGKQVIKKIIINGTRMRFALGSFKELKIKVPPIELQTQFAQIVEKTETLKTQYYQSLLELENLYGSLSQRAFKGEITLK